jgi:tetrahydromethanopterin S-methyltransferase subunit F
MKKQLMVADTLDFNDVIRFIEKDIIRYRNGLFTRDEFIGFIRTRIKQLEEIKNEIQI